MAWVRMGSCPIFRLDHLVSLVHWCPRWKRRRSTLAIYGASPRFREMGFSPGKQQAGRYVAGRLLSSLGTRLAHEFPDKTIFCLDPQVCPCSTMYRIHPSFLLWTLESLVKGEVVNQVKVEEPTAGYARQALAQMLKIGG